MKYDLVLVGGGLANGLIAYRLGQTRPDLGIAIVEAGERIGGNHTWSFHGSDIGAGQHAWIAPFVCHSWPAHEVRFAHGRRLLDTSYHSIASPRLDELVRAQPNVEVHLAHPVHEVSAHEVVTQAGERFAGRAIVDGRGAVDSPHLVLGFQKFLGLEVRLAAPHGLAHPILMDGTVAQIDGFRFVYVLPLAADRLLVEDTYYSDGRALEAEALERRILDYAAAAGWPVAGIEREERGVLPITLAGDIDAFWRDGTPGVARSGMRAALFHPTTGYSFPEAVRLADAVAAAPDLAADPLAALTRKLSHDLWRRQGFYRLLNRMLFLAAEPSRRIDVMARFYRLPDRLIARFYAGRSSFADKLRILAGRPPVRISRALKALSPQAAVRERP